MTEVLIKSFTFIFIIAIAYTLKRLHVLKKRDGDVLATIIMNITLPCALLTSANGIEINGTILILILIGVVVNLVMISIGYITNRKQNNIIKGAFMINTSGYNIGNFVLPFVEAFFPGMGVIYLCSFDIGNALMGLGITYAIADYVAKGESNFSVKELLKKLCSSIPFDVYIIIFILAIFKIKIPTPILSVTATIGAGNSFLAMMMIGLLLEIKISKKEIQYIKRILSIRVVASIIISLLTYFFLPVPKLAKIILILAYQAPLSSVSGIFTKRIGYNGDMSATTNSLSIIISSISITLLLYIFV